MQETLIRIGITILVSAIVCFIFMMFVKIAPGYNQGIVAGMTLGAEQQTKLFQADIEKQQVEGIFTATTSGQFYIRVK